MTPLEQYLTELKQSKAAYCIDGTRMAVGTDKSGYSPLLEGIKWICSVNQNVDDLDYLLVPQCLSHELVRDGGAWSEERNLRWIETVTKGADRPMLCHVFHKQAAEALHAIKGSAAAEAFDHGYLGNRNATFKEVMVLLRAGYTKVTSLHRAEHAVLWRQ